MFLRSRDSFGMLSRENINLTYYAAAICCIMLNFYASECEFNFFDVIDELYLLPIRLFTVYLGLFVDFSDIIKGC
jgi:hypothetical protein